MVKLSPNLATLHPNYVRAPQRHVAGYLSKLDRMDLIERNYNLD